jgi:hypothetical protein
MLQAESSSASQSERSRMFPFSGFMSNFASMFVLLFASIYGTVVASIVSLFLRSLRPLDGLYLLRAKRIEELGERVTFGKFLAIEKRPFTPAFVKLVGLRLVRGVKLNDQSRESS